MWKADHRPTCWIWTGPQQWTLDEVKFHWPDRLNRCPLKRKGWGWPAGQNQQGFGAMYHPLDGLKRQAYAQLYTSYRLAHKGTTLAIYGGSAWIDEFTTTGTLAWVDFFDPRKARGMLEGVIQPWIEEISSIDPHEWWWDAASGQGMKSATAWMDYLWQRYDMHGGLEAIPMLAPGQPDLAVCQAYPVMASAAGFIDNPNMGIQSINVAGWFEPHAFITSTPTGGTWVPEYSPTQVADLLKRGWIVDCDPWSWLVVEAGYKLAGVPLPAGSV